MVRRGEHPSLDLFQLLHLIFQGRDLVLQLTFLQLCHCGFGSIGRVHGGQVALDARFDLRDAPLHLGSGEILVAVVHRLELTAIDGHDRR